MSVIQGGGGNIAENTLLGLVGSQVLAHRLPRHQYSGISIHKRATDCNCINLVWILVGKSFLDSIEKALPAAMPAWS